MLAQVSFLISYLELRFTSIFWKLTCFSNDSTRLRSKTRCLARSSNFSIVDFTRANILEAKLGMYAQSCVRNAYSPFFVTAVERNHKEIARGEHAATLRGK